MDVTEARVQRQLSAISLRDFYDTLLLSFPEPEDPLEIIRDLVAQGLPIYACRPTPENADPDQIKSMVVAATLAKAQEAMLSNDWDEDELVAVIEFEDEESVGGSNNVAFTEAWVSRNMVKKAFEAAGATRYPWPMGPWPSHATECSWYPTDTSLNPTAPPIGLGSNENTSVTKPQQVPTGGNRLVSTGTHLEISFEGKTATFKATKGIRYIFELIQRQGREVRVEDLERTINPPNIDDIDFTHSLMTSDQLEEEGLTAAWTENAVEGLDKQTIRECKARLKRIDDELEIARETNNAAEIARLNDEKSKYATYLSSSVAHDGEPRTKSARNKRVKDAVKKCIREGVVAIGKQLPLLEEHLRHLHRGSALTYSPTPPVTWEIIHSKPE